MLLSEEFVYIHLHDDVVHARRHKPPCQSSGDVNCGCQQCNLSSLSHGSRYKGRLDIGMTLLSVF